MSKKRPGWQGGYGEIERRGASERSGSKAAAVVAAAAHRERRRTAQTQTKVRSASRIHVSLPSMRMGCNLLPVGAVAPTCRGSGVGEIEEGGLYALTVVHG